MYDLLSKSYVAVKLSSISPSANGARIGKHVESLVQHDHAAGQRIAQLADELDHAGLALGVVRGGVDRVEEDAIEAVVVHETLGFGDAVGAASLRVAGVGEPAFPDAVLIRLAVVVAIEVPTRLAVRSRAVADAEWVVFADGE